MQDVSTVKDNKLILIALDALGAVVLPTPFGLPGCAIICVFVASSICFLRLEPCTDLLRDDFALVGNPLVEFFSTVVPAWPLVPLALLPLTVGFSALIVFISFAEFLVMAA